MPIQAAQALRQILSLMNTVSSGTYGFVLDDPRRTLYEAVEAMVEADEEVYHAASQIPWARAELITESTDIAHGGEVPSHLGPLAAVLIKRATGETYKKPRGRKESAEIERYRDNTGSSPADAYGFLAHDAAGSPLSGFYDLTEEDLLHFTGSAARVRYVPAYSRTLRTVYDAGVDTGVNPRFVNSATAAFATTDEGGVIVLAGAGASGVAFGAEVRTRNSATQILTVEAATTTVTNQQLIVARCQSPAIFQPTVVGLAQIRMQKEGDDMTRAEFIRRSLGALAPRQEAAA